MTNACDRCGEVNPADIHTCTTKVDQFRGVTKLVSPQAAMQQALNLLLATGEHDQLCGVFDLDDEGRHCACTCGLEKTTAALRQALEQQPAMEDRGPSPHESHSTKSVRINGSEYLVHKAVAKELLRLNLHLLKESEQQPADEPVAYLVYAKGSRRYFTLTFDVNKVPEIYIGGEVVNLYTRPQPAAPAIPEGWKLVPVEPTQEMLEAYVNNTGKFHSGRSDWEVMLAAAPERKNGGGV